MDFRILGPFEAMDDTGPVKLTGGKQMALLALLLLHAERVVSMDRLVDDLWGHEVPDSAQKMVQIFVSQLRKQLPDKLLCTRAPGLWGAKTSFTPRDHPDLQAEPSADAANG